jgi:hypothetical protein
MNNQKIRVFYPATESRIALRTEEDWDRNVEPVRTYECGLEFLITTERPFFYFKPMLVRDGAV